MFQPASLSSFSDEKSASSAPSDLSKMLSRGGFLLTKFTSNYKSVSMVPFKRRSTPEMNLHPKELPSERAFVVRWSVETDKLGFKIKHLNRPETKRGILSAICFLYDLLGFAALETITARALIHDIWKTKLDLDQPLEDGFLVSWRSWVNQLPSLARSASHTTLLLPRRNG